MNNTTNLRPVTFINGKYNYHRQNLFQQNLLLKALQVTTDPVELKKMAGIKTITEVYRTLDKMAIRKEYHEALMRQGLDLDTITTGFKNLCGSPNEIIKLKAYQSLLKSLGLDEYKENLNEASEGWETTLRSQIEKEKDISLPSGNEVEEYEVIVPEIPKEEIERMENENKIGKSLYEKSN